MKRILVGILLVTAMSFGFVGCSEKTKVQEQTKVRTEGGTTTETKTDEVKKTGDNPPPAPGKEP